ncbi:MAG: hypothetical protein QGH39_07930 [Candidatus Thermoplasmatota archaeon]|nr:hypothetical protein [Candidatus Thermoplasmatota archaeon]
MGVCEAQRTPSARKPTGSRKELAPEGEDAFPMHPEGNVPRMQVNFNSPEQRGHRNAVVSPHFQAKPVGLGFSSKDVPYWHV